MKPMTRRVLIAMLVLVVALMPITAALAKGPPAKVIISGPGIDGEMEITDMEVLEGFGIYQFNDLEMIISNRVDFTPDVALGEGYHITRYVYENNSTEYMVWDRVTYYPDPEGGAGYIFFDGLDPSIGTTQGQGLWMRAHPEGDAVMQQVMEMAAAQRAAVQSPSLPSVNPLLIVGIVALGSVLLVISVAMQRRDRTVTEF